MSNWKLDQAIASFAIGDWRGSIDLGHPANGLCIGCGDGDNQASILASCVSSAKPTSLAGNFSSSSDLIVPYPQRDGRHFHLQLDYRLLDAQPDSLLIELWISVQTYLLDSRPAVDVACDFHRFHIRCGDSRRDPSDWLQLDKLKDPTDPFDASRRVVAVDGWNHSDGLYQAWFVHPRDQTDTRWTRSNESSAMTASLFDHFMEKE